MTRPGNVPPPRKPVALAASFRYADTLAPPRFHVRVARVGPRVTVSMTGEFDLTSAAELRRTIGACISDQTVTGVVFDLSAVSFMDCAGFHALVYTANEMTRRRGTTAMHKVPDNVRRLLDALRLDDALALAA